MDFPLEGFVGLGVGPSFLLPTPTLVAGMMGQPQNTQMGNPGYDPWRLQIHPKVAEKLKDQPVGLFF